MLASVMGFNNVVVCRANIDFINGGGKVSDEMDSIRTQHAASPTKAPICLCDYYSTDFLLCGSNFITKEVEVRERGVISTNYEHFGALVRIGVEGVYPCFIMHIVWRQ